MSTMVKKLGPMPEHIRQAPRISLNAAAGANWPPHHEVLWAAGFWEGEGSAQRGNIKASQGKSSWALDRLQYYFGGTARQESPRRNGYQPYQWWVSGENAREFARQIYPHLSPERQQSLFDKFLKHYRQQYGAFWLDA